ncbi:uncharacterized protein zgc:66474 isoform X3 [Puntigrus tetrazona]|uniref:uncharacterized protein zgc:66474 isoform X3 n=1 Tax=Puntigrus tetrazona TaxID=1606681 RepID=UPI001C8A4EA9|nr:uncharacterized protein zgc:66474 isoform X3 [Puntigrus tetrazona]
MTKLQLLHRALNERLMAAVEQIMEMVGGTVLEYEEETIRARKENEVLRRRLRWMEGANRADWPGPSEPVSVSTTDEANPSRQDEGAVNFGFGPESEAVVIKTEATDLPLCSIPALPQSIDQGPDNAGTGTGIAYGLVDNMTWDSAQNYMAPLDFDPTSGPSRVRHWRSQNRRQRMSFACPDCGKVFGSKQRLMVHMRIHSTERPYAYRRRKACFYGDNKKKSKLHRLSKLREIVDDLSDGSEQTNRSSASPETTAPGHEEEPESDHTSSDKEPEKRITTPVRNRREKKRVVNQTCQCPHCPHRVFARPCQLALHMKTHTVTALVNLPSQAHSGTEEIVDANRRLPKRQRKIYVEKKAKVADKSDFPCPDCDKVFFHASRLRVHMKSHETKRALLHRARQIKTELTKEETMEVVPKTTEVQNVKEVKKTYACPHCDKVFAREGWLMPHIRTHHGEVRNRSDYFNVYGSGRTRSQQLVTKRLRKRKAQKREITKKMRLNSQKTKGSRKVKAKASQTSDESILVVDVPTFTKDDAEESTDLPILGTDEAGESEHHSVMGTDDAEESVNLPKIGTDETQQSADLSKKGTDESEGISEQSKDISGSDCGTSSTKYQRTTFPCATCGKDFILEKRLKKHSRKHIGHRLQDEKKRKREQVGMTIKKKEETKWEGKKRLDDEMPTNNHNPNATQTPHGSSKKDLLRKSRNRGQGPLPCPFCGKVFAWEMRLLMHMQIHCGEKPYAYRQRKKRFYGDLKRGKIPKIHNQEPSGDKSDESEEAASEETVNKGRSAHLNSNAIHAVSGALASSTAIEQPTTSYKSNQRTKTTRVSDIMSHFNMQPRIILQPIMTACKNWSSVPQVADLKAGCPGKSSGFDHEQTSKRADDEMVEAVEDEIVDSNPCKLAVEFSGHGTQNKPEICYTKTEIVCMKVGSQKHDSEVQHDNVGSSVVFESSAGNNVKSQQKGNCNFHFPGVSENTPRDQVSLIVIDDEPEQSYERTAAENALPECGRTTCDYVEDNVDGGPSKGLNTKKTTSRPSTQNKQLEVGRTPGKNSSSDSICPASDTTESTKSTDGASQHTDGQSISHDPVRDQMAFTTIRQTKDRPTGLEERISCQASDMVFAGQECLSDINADKKLLDMETVSSERKNNKLGLNKQMSESLLDDSADNSDISGMNEPSVQNVKNYL